MCYSNCKHENYDGECTKSKRTLYDIECHCTEESDFEDYDDILNGEEEAYNKYTKQYE